MKIYTRSEENHRINSLSYLNRRFPKEGKIIYDV